MLPTNGNPKDAIGRTKLPLSQLPEVAIIQGALAIYEGSLKYGFRNYREYPVNALVYVDAMFRHLQKWANGQEADPKTTVNHLGYVIAGAAILLDAQLHGTLVDDRHQTGKAAHLIDEMSSVVAKLHELFGTDTRLLPDREDNNGVDGVEPVVESVHHDDRIPQPFDGIHKLFAGVDGYGTPYSGGAAGPVQGVEPGADNPNRLGVFQRHQ